MRQEELEFCRTLLEKLKELEREDRIFEGGLEKLQEIGKEDSNCGADLTPIAYAMVGELKKQIDIDIIHGNLSNLKEVASFIELVEEFLGIFGKDEPPKIPFKKHDRFEFEKMVDGVYRLRVERKGSHVEFGENEIPIFDFHGEENIIRDILWFLSNTLDLHLKKMSNQGEEVEIYENI